MKYTDIRCYYLFLGHKKGTEMRAIGFDGEESYLAGKTHVNNADDFVNFCKKYDGEANIYAGINERKPGGTTKKDVVSAKFIPFDIDSEHPKGQAATKSEMKKAEKVANQIYNDFRDFGFPMMIMSGNGYQLLYKIPAIRFDDYERDDVEEKIQTWIRKIQNDYNIKGVHIDQVGDLPRILKVPGTLSIKGKNTVERPWRRAKIVKNRFPEECNLLKDEILNIDIEKFKNKQEDMVKNVDIDIIDNRIEQNKKFKELYEDGKWMKYNYPSRSEAEYYLVMNMIKMGLNDNQIYKGMLKSEVGKWQEEDDVWRDYIIKSARDDFYPINGKKFEEISNLAHKGKIKKARNIIPKWRKDIPNYLRSLRRTKRVIEKEDDKDVKKIENIENLIKKAKSTKEILKHGDDSKWMSS